MKRWLCSAFLAAVAFVTLSGSLHGQVDNGYHLRVDSRLIDTTVIVRDAKGNPVTGLPQTAFHISEDGVPQTVRYFASQRELPLSIGLIVDASGSQDTFVKEHEKEIEVFLKEVMEPRDHAFVICFGNHLRLTSDWTSSPTDVLDGITRFNKGDRDFPELGPQEERKLGTALFDAIYFPITERMVSERGRRRVLIVLSDGEENSSEHDFVDTVTAAQGADTLVYAVRTTEHKSRKMDARDRYGARVLDHMTEATGGRAFDAHAQSAKSIFASIAADLRSMYEIGYYSTNSDRTPTFRKVTIAVDGDGLTVQARAGYVSH
jgi:Ca-activated chloride channel family protein